MLGNIVTGCSVMAPAAMLSELSAKLDVSIRTAGLLITFGAAVLCVGSPLTAWLTSRIERRRLLTTTLAVMACGNLASAFAPGYMSLLAIRLFMLAIAALYTPQAAGSAALIVPAEKRGSAIAYVFLGWSVAVAAGLPLITFMASRYGWRAAYGAIGALGLVSLLLLAWRLPRGLKGVPVDLKTWGQLGRNPDGRSPAPDHDLADVRPVPGIHLHRPAFDRIDPCRTRRRWPRVRALWRVRLCRHRHRLAHRGWLGRLQDVSAGDRAGACGIDGVGGLRRQLPADVRLGRALGFGIRLLQFDAAGQVGRR